MQDLWGGSLEQTIMERLEAIIFYGLVMFGVMFLLLRMLVVILQVKISFHLLCTAHHHIVVSLSANPVRCVLLFSE
jgi:hypothetical protein